MFSRRNLLKTAALATVAGRLPAAMAKMGNSPNIVFITMDQHRFDAMGCAGNTIIHTPNLDALAARGAMFSKTYTQGPLCQPARASLMTGQYVKTHGQSWNGFNMKPEWPTMMKAFQTAGYTTAIIGKTHFYGTAKYENPAYAGTIDLRTMTPWSLTFGLDYLLEEFDRYLYKRPGISTAYTDFLAGKGMLDAYRAEIPEDELSGGGQIGHTSALPEEVQLSSFIGDHAIDWLKGYKADKPFFLWVSFIEPHPPIIAAAEWASFYENAAIPTGTRQLPDMPDNAWGKYLRGWATATKSITMTDEQALQMARYYYGTVSQVDRKIGEVVKAIDESGHGQDTWIVYTADHGEMLGHHNLVFKMVFYNGAVRVPNIIVPPGGATPQRVDSPVEGIDVTATMLDVAGIQLPTCEGRSLVPLMNGNGKPREVVHSELAGFFNKGNYFVMAATEQYRYLYDKENKIGCELFDLQSDPDEMHNLIDDPGHAGIRDDLHKDYIAPFIGA